MDIREAFRLVLAAGEVRKVQLDQIPSSEARHERRELHEALHRVACYVRQVQPAWEDIRLDAHRERDEQLARQQEARKAAEER